MQGPHAKRRQIRCKPEPKDEAFFGLSQRRNGRCPDQLRFQQSIFGSTVSRLPWWSVVLSFRALYLWTANTMPPWIDTPLICISTGRSPFGSSGIITLN